MIDPDFDTDGYLRRAAKANAKAAPAPVRAEDTWLNPEIARLMVTSADDWTSEERGHVEEFVREILHGSALHRLIMGMFSYDFDHPCKDEPDA